MQHLREALWVSRQEAVDSLRHTRGDVEAALRQELAAFAMDLTALRRLAVEYAEYRLGTSPPQASASLVASSWTQGNLAIKSGPSCMASSWRAGRETGISCAAACAGCPDAVGVAAMW